MNPSLLIKKLGMRPGQRVLILNAPPGYVESLAGLPEEVEVSYEPEGEYDCVHLFVKNRAEFQDLSPAAVQALTYDGLLWLSYPKKSSKVKTDLSREVMWELMEGTGLRPVSQISIDEVWSALRFRPSERVGR